MPDASPLRTALVFGSYRRDANGMRVVRFLEKQLQQRPQQVTTVLAKEWDLPMLDRMYKEYEAGQAPEKLEKLREIVLNTDLFLVVSGEYNHTIQPGLTNLMFHFLEEYRFKAAGIVSYSPGGFGGARMAVHLRAPLAEMGLITIPSMLNIPGVHRALTQEGTPAEGEAGAALEKFSARFVDEAEWYARALREAKAQGTPY
jgi:NAD(P)H-dependent FMN reductase